MLKIQTSPSQLDLLNRGIVETRHLMDALSVDFHRLCTHVFPDFILAAFPAKTGFIKRMQLTSFGLYQQYGFGVLKKLSEHQSDTIRSFACYVIAAHDSSLQTKLERMRPLADDHHFGVREWAWIALRPDIITNHSQAIEILSQWAEDQSENVRRFASEATRPRGVWCSHVKILREQPWLASKILEPLKVDPARYVQLSVGNWLNDASKDHPDWVRNTCSTWLSQSDSVHTQKICKRGLRTLNIKSMQI